MKVAFDSGPLSGGDSFRGIGMYTRELIDALKTIQKRDPKQIKVDVVDFSKTNLTSYDIIQYSKFHPFFVTLPLDLLMPKFRRPKTVVLIHDLIQLIYPKAYPPGIRGKLKFAIQKMLVRRVDGILTISETSKKDIVRFLGIPSEKVFNTQGGGRSFYKVVNDGGVLNKVASKYNLPRKFALYVGDVNYNKNLMTLADACKKVKITLVIAGKHAVSRDIDFDHPENQPIKAFLEKYQDDPMVMRLGFVPDEDMIAIYNLATVYIQPSFYEGFGMPVLEAMACGVPVIVAKTQALVELAGDAALVSDPYDIADFADKIIRIVNNSSEKVRLVRKGFERVKEFTWAECANKTYEFYRQILGD